MSKEKFKPLSFSTTMRNPYRIIDFLKCLKKVENKILTKDIIYEVAKDVINNKFYFTRYELSVLEYKTIYKNEDLSFSNEDLDDIILNSKQKHKEVGFEEGWPSRFDTWYKFPMELGFCYYGMNEKIEISKIGNMLIEAESGENNDEEKIKNIFLNAMVKYQTNNPFRKNRNDNVPLMLLLQVIDLFHKNNYNTHGIYRSELSFFICWPNNNAYELYNEIIKFRTKYRFVEYTDEIVYEKCLEILKAKENEHNYFKMEKITGEAIDEYIRKMRITGVISLRGNGRFVDINTLEIEKIAYILDKYSNYQHFNDRKKYYLYMNELDEYLFLVNKEIEIEVEDNVRQKTLYTFAKEYDKKEIYDELIKVCKKKESSNQFFKLISAPVRLEFLVSIALIQAFDNIKVYPNYVVDDEGLPICTASGGKADIVCKIEQIIICLVEVSLIMGRQQLNNEMIPISRHLSDYKKDFANIFSIFVAPNIHDDAKRYASFIYYDENLLIKVFAINDFLKALKYTNNIEKLGTNK